MVNNIDTKEKHNCLMDYSEHRELLVSKSFLNFSIKYVINGVVNYKVNDTSFRLESGQYLLTGLNSEGTIMIDSKSTVKGMCMAISPNIIQEVLSQHLEPALLMPQGNYLHLFNCDEFLENKYSASSTSLGKYLAGLETFASSQQPGIINGDSEMYYTITENLFYDYLPLQKMYKRVKGVKNSTRKELFRRLLLARNHLADSLSLKPGIADIANAHGFSEYHFYRLFKNTFQISPYQYQLNNRLLHAKELLLKNQMSVSDVAFACGFNDVHTFSKAFKKKFYHSPSTVSVRPISRI